MALELSLSGPPFCLGLCLCVPACMSPSHCVSAGLSVSVFWPVCLRLSASVSLPACLSVCLSVCLSLSLALRLCSISSFLSAALVVDRALNTS